jgi:hypothetical protein
MKRKQLTVELINETLEKEEFINNHKAKPTDFTRQRVLKFIVVFMLVLRKTVKSIQISLNELYMQGNIDFTVTSSAYVQARNKFRHTAFIELNDRIKEVYYSEPVKKWKGYRCLATDGSQIILPNTPEMKEIFGEIRIKNQTIEGSYVSGLFECCYDVLNHIEISSILAPGPSYEVDLAIQMLEATTEKDLLIYDRGYASYEFLAALVTNNKNYIIRCPKSSFKATESLFNQEGEAWSKVVCLKAGDHQKKELKEKGLPLEISVRFVSVILSSGEVEVLATSLIQNDLERNDFKQAYYLRWGVESYYNVLKGRLALENFTGRTVEAVKQDLWSTIFVSNLETILTEETEEEINAQKIPDQCEKKINKAVSFNVIKNMAFDLFLNEKDKSKIFEKMERLFKMNANVKRPDRSPPRKECSARRSYNFTRREKKQVF